MSVRARGDVEARLQALASRIDAAIEHTRVWVPPVSGHAPSATGPDHAQLRAELDAASATASLQIQRCAALEDHVVELKAALEGAHRERAESEASAQRAQSEASRALDELESERSAASEHSASAPNSAPGLGPAFQAKLLENDRLRSERDTLRRQLEQWRSQARDLRRERDTAAEALAKLELKFQTSQQQEASSRQRVDELQREVNEQRRELELAERRTKHLRQHIVPGR